MQLKNLTSLCVASATIALCISTNAATVKATERPTLINNNAKLKTFIKKMQLQYHFPTKTLQHYFEHTYYLPEVINRIKLPFEKKAWNYYKQYFVSPKNIDAGVKYWLKHKATLLAAQKKYKVNPWIIVAIIGMESHYGQYIGKYQTMGALATLAFNYQPRATFFNKELTDFLILARKNKLNILKIQGSYAGALGIPQFMPSSYLHYGVGYKLKTKVDLFSNDNDAIFSVANYLQQAGWRGGQPITIPVTLKYKANITTKTVANIKQLSKLGVKIDNKFKLKPKQRAILIALASPKNTEYWLGLRNFRAILNYNKSPSYAMAAYQLSRAIKNKNHEYPKFNKSTQATPTG